MESLRDRARTRGDSAADGGAAEIARLHDLVASLLEQNVQLQHALDSRIVIEQAKGVLAERFGLDVRTAFSILRRAARSHRMSIHVLAARVVASRDTPSEIEEPTPAA